MTNASTAGGGKHERPNDAEPFFPSEGSFNTVVPLSEVARAPLARGNAAEAGRPAEAAWARTARRAEVKEEEEATLVPARVRGTSEARARGTRSSWGLTAATLALSVVAGVAAGAYLVWSAQRTPAPVVEATAATRTANDVAPPETTEPEANAKEPDAVAGDGKALEERSPEVSSAGRSNEAPRATKEAKTDADEPARAAAANEPTSRAPSSAAARAARPARATAEDREVTPAPKPAPRQSHAASRATAAAKQPPSTSTSARSLPVSAPPPSARSKKVIQWP